jgi:hypothetical protein
MRSNIEGASLYNNMIEGKNRLRRINQTLTGTLTMDDDMEHLLFLDPGGAGRTVLLPAESAGLWFVIANTADAAEDLTVKEDSNTTTIGVVTPGKVAMFFCDGTTWHTDNVAAGDAGQGGLSRVTVTTLSTAGNETLTAAQLLGGLILRDPNGGARTDTLPTAALLVAALPGYQIGDAFEFTIRNTADAAETITVAAGTGGTASGTMTIAQNNSKRFLLRIDSATAYTVYSLGTVVH